VAAGEVPNPRQVRLEQGIELVGFEAQLADAETKGVTATVAPGEPAVLRVTAFWRAYERPAQDHTVFVHLYDRAGHLVASHDGPPLYGYLPTSQWQMNEIVPDRHDIRLPTGLPAGQYRLATGMYLAATGERLAVTAARGSISEDSIDLQTITIPAR